MKFFQYLTFTIPKYISHNFPRVNIYSQSMVYAVGILYDHIRDLPFSALQPSEDLEVNGIVNFCPVISEFIPELAKMVLVESEFRSKGLTKGGPIASQAPVFIIGATHTGTTFLHNLMSCDPRVNYFKEIDVLAPTMDFGKTTEERFVSIIKEDLVDTQQGKEFLRDMLSHKPAECSRVMNHAIHLEAGQESIPLDHPGRRQLWQWLISPETVARHFKYHHTFAQLMNSQIGEGYLPQIFLFKEPHHINNLQHLLKEYPNAKFVWTHRNILDMAKSTVGLRRQANWPRSLFKDFLTGASRCLIKAMDIRDQMPDGASRFCDVYFEDLLADPMGTLERVYQHLQLGDEPRGTLSEEHKTAARAWLDKNYRSPALYPDISAADCGFEDDFEIVVAFRYYLAQHSRCVPEGYLVQKVGSQIAILME